MSRLMTIVLLLAPVISTGGCTDTPASPTVNPAFIQTDLVVEGGDTALIGGTVQVDYTG